MHHEGPVQQNGVPPLAMLQHLHRLTVEALFWVVSPLVPRAASIYRLTTELC